jgi:hypothetical protein
MSTAPPVHSVTLPTGEVVTSDMTPEARAAIVYKAHGVTVETVKAPPQQPSLGTLAEYDRRDAEQAARAAPAPVRGPAETPAEFAARAPTPEQKLAQLHKELTDAGIATVEQPVNPSPGTFAVDEMAVAKLNKVYRELNPDDRAKYRETFHRDMLDIHNGRKWGESREAFLARLGQKPGEAPAAPEAAPVAAAAPTEAEINAAVDVATKASDADGFAPAASIGAVLRWGYEIPQDMEFNVEQLVAGLKLAREGGLSQTQVNKILKASV